MTMFFLTSHDVTAVMVVLAVTYVTRLQCQVGITDSPSASVAVCRVFPPGLLTIVFN